MVWRKMRANTGHLRCAGLSPYRKTEDQGADFGVCLCGAILVSRFHKRIAPALGAARAMSGHSRREAAPCSALVKNSSSKSEDGALVSPHAGNTMKQPLDRHGSRLATFDDCFDDIGRKVSKSQKPADIGVVEFELPGDLHRVGIFSATKVSHP
jgi:hypothetical protein